ncbi:mucin-2 isoform X6 [Aedes albopictus]|uniref:Insect pheromone-binding family n=1 Tax=Aedes albopictus TaxID=7160 RepID=A0ABM1ZDS7_AEDAL|nr:mucin-2-like isoform X5 [Aedes albopictus]
MRNVWILVASALLAFANFVKSQDTARNLYSSRYDNLDIDTILGSSRLVNNYVDCLLSRKPCPPEGKDLKRILPEALRTKCARCSATQKENALKIITTLYYQYPEQYMALRERWDPSGEYHRRFEEYIAGLQFNQIGSNGNDRPVRNDFDRDQSQVLLQTLILSTTTVAPPPPPPPSPLPSQNALPNGPEQPRPQQLAPSAQLTQPLPSWMFDRRPQEQQSQQLQQVQQSTSTNTVQSRPSQLVANGAQNSDQSNGSQNFNRPLNLAEPDATTTARTTPLITTTRLILRPVDGLDFSTNTRPTVGTLGNRFGGEDPSTASGSSAAEFGTTAPSPAATVRPTTRPVVRQTTSRIVTPRPTPNRFQFEAAPAGAIPVFRPQQPQQQQPGQVQVFAQPAQPQAPSQTQVITSSSSFAVGVGPTMTTPNNVIDNFFIPPGQGGGFGATNNNQNNPNASPFVGLFNSIGNKLATTADAIAGMLRRTVDVLVSTHLQAHQQRRSVRSN